jgi:hypothetical protein
MDARVAFTSVGVNRAAGALDWDLAPGTGLIAYGGASAVCLFDPEVSQADAQHTPADFGLLRAQVPRRTR